MEALFAMDVRRIEALSRQTRLSQKELAERARVRADDVSRFFSYVAPGGLMDRLVSTVTDYATEAYPRN